MKSNITTKTKRTSARAIVSVTALVAVAFAALGFAPARAEAWAWDGNVTLQGRAIVCSSAATWVWVEGSNGERGWATQPGGNYSFHFSHVPSSGMQVRVNLGNSVCSRSATFGLNRPAVGTTATRNVVTIY